jgi:hypothetical protein
MKRFKPLRRNPLYPLVLAGLMGIGAYVLFIIRLIWG